MKETVLIKLGGSVITDKSGDCTVNTETLERISRIISSHSGIQFLIVHGAGSCGHPEAKRHHLDKGLDPNNKSGIFITHRAVLKLNTAVVNALRANGVEAVGIHPLDACTAKNGRLETFSHQPVEMLVHQGIVPVLHGDVVMDSVRGACIVSGDQLVSAIPARIHVDRIGLATDVAGVLRDGDVIPLITRDTVADIEIGESDNTDVTGGMIGKLKELLRLSDEGTESTIFHLSRLEDFLDGREHGGTVVTGNRV
jgi:isopentenyl phosphate kinase